ncbi:MAG TPA: Ig-like domain-containing protein [Longimicrobiales bacterium]
MTVEVTPRADTLNAIGDTLELSATVVAGDSVLDDATISWSSLDPEIATVSEGRVVGVTNGTARITAVSGDAADTASITVRQILAEIVVSPPTDTLVPGDELLLHPAALDSNAVVIDGIDRFTWTTSDDAIIAVDSGGIVEALATGQATVSASYGESEGTAEITVDWLRLDWVGTGLRFTCGLTAAGDAYCWGYNESGQLGVGDTLSRAEPIRVSGGLTFRALAVGNWHACGITAEGKAYCWGANWGGQLGTETDASYSTVPVPVGLDAEVVSVSGGGLHTCALTASGQAYCWGRNGYGQLGAEPSIHGTTPVRVSGDRTFTALATGGLHTCGLTADGVAYCWGYNALGQLGIGANDTLPHIHPAAVSGGLTFTFLEARGNNTCGITGDGTGYCWGVDDRGEVGDGANSPTCIIGTFEHNCAAAPSAVSAAFAFRSLNPAHGGAGASYACGIASDGAAYCWGFNFGGNLGTGAADSPDEPTAVVGGHTFRSLSAGGEHTCGIADDAYTYCWGSNGDGQLGDGSTTLRATPVPVARQGA